MIYLSWGLNQVYQIEVDYAPIFSPCSNFILVSGSGRGRFPSGRGGFRSESFRGRGKFGGGRGYGRNEFRNQGEFTARPKGSAGQKGDSSQRSSQNGSGRGGRQGVGNRSSTTST